LTTVMALYYGFTADEPRHSWVRERAAARYGGSGTLARSSLQWSGIPGQLLAWWVSKADAADHNAPRVRQTHIALTRAGFNQVEQLAVYRAARVASFVLLIALGLVIAHFYPRWRVPAVLGGAVIGYLLPGNLVKRLGRKRQLTILHELPAILDLLVVTLEAGQGLLEAIRVVGRETARQGRVLGKEFTTAAAEMSAGVSLEDSMRNLSERTGVDDLKAIGAVFIQSKEIGGRLGPSLRAAGELLSTKRRLMAEEAAQKSSVKMLLPLVLFILPAMMIIILGPAIIQIFQMIMGAAA
ncbi:MAG TPA: type II secretion system F family protein, partial [Candidatus Binataceae bacterium]|nr:type II secretion system F family protein [Candidatus Binataceae bacterium]